MPSIEDLLPPSPDQVLDAAKGSLCDVVDGALEIVKTPISVGEKVTSRIKNIAPR